MVGGVGGSFHISLVKEKKNTDLPNNAIALVQHTFVYIGGTPIGEEMRASFLYFTSEVDHIEETETGRFFGLKETLGSRQRSFRPLYI